MVNVPTSRTEFLYNITVTEDKDFLLQRKGSLSRRTAALLPRTRVIVMEDSCIFTEDKVCFFVYRLVSDAKPDRGMM